MMQLVKQLVKRTKEKIQALLILVGDQPLYAKAMEISWFIHGYGPDGFLPQMGQFHINQIGLQNHVERYWS